MLKAFALSAGLLLCPVASLVAQSPSSAKPMIVQLAKSGAVNGDYSKEAFVVEQFSYKQRFENDGTSLLEESSRVRIQSDAGVKRYGLLSLSYSSGTGTFEVAYVRVRKPDGSVVETPPENMQDMAAPITREAPFYSDLHEKHIAVKGLGIGDLLEYRFLEHTTKPLAPGQFWTEYRFSNDLIVLDEQVELSVPSGRSIKMKSRTVQPVVSDADGYRTYTWHHASLQHKDDTNQKREAIELLWQQARGRLPQADVLLTSFASWEEVGRWYGSLQEDRVAPTPEVTAKAAELTRNASTDDAKVRALYDYVSTQFRYIGISFGIGRYQPHAANEVLANQYGDCKDKHTLLAALLTSVGIPAYPALISTSYQLDRDVPSPGQFDHVITLVPRGDRLIWLDATAEVGPYQYLIPRLRDKQALAIWKDKPVAVVNTPAQFPYSSTQKFDMEAKLSEAGILEGHADFWARGDVEYILRSSFRAVPLPQWKDLAQQISQSYGFGGEVSEPTASSPEKTDEPFHFSYQYTRKDFGDWSNHRILSPSPLMALAAPSEETLLPLGPSWLNSPGEMESHTQLELPEGYRPELPPAIHLKRDFAQYDSTYEFKSGRMISDRHLKTLLSEVPASKREEYMQFMKTVLDDYGQFIPLSSGTISSPGAPRIFPATLSFALKSLPNSLNPEASRLELDADSKLASQDIQSGMSSLYRAVTADPNFARAWAVLGTVLFMQHQDDAGVDAFHKAIAAAPTEATIPKALGWSLMADARFADAVPVWQNYLALQPDDLEGTANLGRCLMVLKRYAEAATAYESAAEKHRDRADLHESVGSAYLLAGNREKAEAAFAKIDLLDAEAGILNDAAYQMANADLNLPMALNYSKKAVRSAETESGKINLETLTVEDLKSIQQLAAAWDTLGWVYERMSDLDQARQYLRASWKLTQDGTAAAHLCHLYAQTQQTAAAIKMCRLALYRLPMSNNIDLDQFKSTSQEVQENLTRLTKRAAGSNDLVETSELVSRERAFKLQRFLPGTESAEFWVLLAPNGKTGAFKVEDVKFISGSDKMKLQGNQLKSINFDFPVPGQSSTRFVRRGILGCYEHSGCSFVLLDPSSANSLN